MGKICGTCKHMVDEELLQELKLVKPTFVDVCRGDGAHNEGDIIYHDKRACSYHRYGRVRSS